MCYPSDFLLLLSSYYQSNPTTYSGGQALEYVVHVDNHNQDRRSNMDKLQEDQQADEARAEYVHEVAKKRAEEAMKEWVHEDAEYTADAWATEAAEEAYQEAYDDMYRDAYDEAHKKALEGDEARQVYDEAYKEAYEEALADDA
jgi:hypothetical protein